MHVVVASKNPTKVNAVQEAFTAVFDQHLTPEALEITPVSVESGVPDQPVGDDETRRGALNRVQAAQTLHPRADFWVGVEGGVVWHRPVSGTGTGYGDPSPVTGEGQAELECMAWVMVLGADGRLGRARSNGFQLPPAMAELIRGGMPQNVADDQVLGRVDSGTTNGTVGYLSHNLITRTHYTRDTVILALAPFLHPEHYLVQARDLLGGELRNSTSKVEESLPSGTMR